MAADLETVARINGKPLLSEEGMSAVNALLTAHIEYDEAEQMHSSEIASIDEQIKELEVQRNELNADKDRAVSAQHKARHSGVYAIRRAVENVDESPNPIYATVIKAMANAEQSGLWYPNNLEGADAMGQSMAAFDAALRATRKPQPVLALDRESSGHVNVYTAKLQHVGGLGPSTIAIEEAGRGYSRRVVNNTALALPVNQQDIVGLQIHPNRFGEKDSLGDYAYQKGPQLRQLKDAFKLLLRPGHIFLGSGLDTLGKYDIPDSRRSGEIKGFESWTDSNRIELAVGTRSVKRALARLRQEFADQATGSGRTTEQQLAFDELSKLALGEIKLPEPAVERPKRVEANFSVV